MFRIIPVPLSHDLTFIDKKRAAELPNGLRTMLEWAFEVMEQLRFKPSAIVVGDEENFLVRTQNTVLQLPNGNAPMSSAENLKLIETWASFLRWYSWWSAPHWTNRATDDGDYFAQCTDCSKTTKGKTWPEKCSNAHCPSHMNWRTVNGRGAS